MSSHLERPRVPALYRTSDIGISSEWRDISYDWSPVLTCHGVFVYSYLRDTYDHQRNLRPFLVSPEGPTKKSIQTKLGLKTSFALQGPEYLLAIVGLLQVDVGYGPSSDPERPNHTHVTYYAVGRLDHPVLDWTMLGRVLDALMLALDPPSPDPEVLTQQKRAEAALRSLGQAGMLQRCDPGDLLYPYGAWPALLPRLIEDERWVALFTQLHRPAALTTYREQARAWVAYASWTAIRLVEENRGIADMVLSAQRRGARSGSMQPSQSSAMAGVPAHVDYRTAATGAEEALQLNQRGLSEGVASDSHGCRNPLQLNHRGCWPPSDGSSQEAVNEIRVSRTHESLQPDSLTNQLTSRWENNDRQSDGREWADEPGEAGSNEFGLALDLSPYLQEAELLSTRQDNAFWCEVNQILTGTRERYPHTHGEKKAAERHFKQKSIPTGVVLAALRAVMDLPVGDRPTSFAAALDMEQFHACVARALLAAPVPRGTGAAWADFLQAYRSLWMDGALRNISQPDCHTLRGLFARYPDDCWEVLRRIEHAPQRPRDLSPQYLERAVDNNRRAAAQRALKVADPRADRDTERIPDTNRWSRQSSAGSPRAEDRRRQLLAEAGLPPGLLRPDWTQEYIQAWLDEANVRQADIAKPVAWLVWGLKSGCLPQDHPELPPPRVPHLRAAVQQRPAATPQASGEYRCGESADTRSKLWVDVLTVIERAVPPSEFATWLRDTSLVDLDDSRAIIGAINVFAHDHVEQHYVTSIEAALDQHLGYPVRVQLVIDG